MNFFEQQDRAKQNTLALIFFFVLAVVLIIIAIYAVLAFFFISAPRETDWVLALQHHWNPRLLAATALGTLAIVATGTLYKMALLSAGGEAVARMLGAEPVDPQSADPARRRLLNIVEEMALASGIPVPRVYLLDEESINAFAAGFSTKDAVIAVTRGCMNLLKRDELQGVIAHEFSHVLNGDMRLNLRLMGVLHGILVISLIGYWIFRITARSPRSRSSGKKGAVPIVLVGLSLMVIGYIGVFFARLIKAAISRQREFLADAAAVQFTRDPGGIAGALKKIGGFVTAGQISHPNAEAASHLFFADGITHAFFNLLATHPPLFERIKRIDPAFDGKFPAAEEINLVDVAKEMSATRETISSLAGVERPREQTIKLDGNRTINSFGRTDSQSLNNVGQWLLSLPDPIRAAAREPGSAQALILAMLVSASREIREKQLAYLDQNAGSDVMASLLSLMPLAENFPPEWVAPLSDLTMPTLRTMRPGELKTFAALVKNVVEADGSITLFEYMIQARVRGQIKSWSRKLKLYDLSSPGIQNFWPAMRGILSTLAYYGNATEEGAAGSFRAGSQILLSSNKEQISPKDQCGLQSVDKALSALEPAPGKIKKLFIEACCACVARDGRVTLSEAELLRAVAASLDCPLPPLMTMEIKQAAEDANVPG